MSEIYQVKAYRSNAIPFLPAGGHPKLDHAFERLAWGHYQLPVAPNTMEAQLAYASLFQDDRDAEDGFPWGESTFSVSKGFLSGLQGFLYVLYMCTAIVFFTTLIGLFFLVLGLVINDPKIQSFINLFDDVKYLYLTLAILYFGGKYGRLLLAHLTEQRQRSNPTGLYRREGVVRIKHRKTVFVAPFIEFDAYLVQSPSGRGGRYYNLVLQHRYSDQQLWLKGLLTDAMDPREVHAYWDMLQQFMDVSHPLPDVPIFEPFRARDPVTVVADERSGRDPFKWRNITPEQWRQDHEQTYRERLQQAQFNHPCILDARIQGRGLPIPEDRQGALLA